MMKVLIVLKDLLILTSYIISGGFKLKKNNKKLLTSNTIINITKTY